MDIKNLHQDLKAIFPSEIQTDIIIYADINEVDETRLEKANLTLSVIREEMSLNKSWIIIGNSDKYGVTESQLTNVFDTVNRMTNRESKIKSHFYKYSSKSERPTIYIILILNKLTYRLLEKEFIRILQKAPNERTILESNTLEERNRIIGSQFELTDEVCKKLERLNEMLLNEEKRAFVQYRAMEANTKLLKKKGLIDDHNIEVKLSCWNDNYYQSIAPELEGNPFFETWNSFMSFQNKDSYELQGFTERSITENSSITQFDHCYTFHHLCYHNNDLTWFDICNIDKVLMEVKVVKDQNLRIVYLHGKGKENEPTEKEIEILEKYGISLSTPADYTDSSLMDTWYKYFYDGMGIDLIIGSGKGALTAYCLACTLPVPVCLFLPNTFEDLLLEKLYNDNLPKFVYLLLEDHDNPIKIAKIKSQFSPITKNELRITNKTVLSTPIVEFQNYIDDFIQIIKKRKYVTPRLKEFATKEDEMEYIIKLKFKNK